MFFTYFVAIANLARDLGRSLTTFQAAPHEHRRLVQCVITLGVQIDEHGFATVEFGIDNMTVWMWCSRSVQGFSFLVNQSLVVAGATITGSDRPLAAELLGCELCQGIFPKLCRQKRQGDPV